jgi:iron(III) transport system permease protein
MQRGSRWLSLATGLISLCAVVPLIYILVRAAGADAAVWRRLWLGQIPLLVGNTIALVLATILLSALFGTGAAWLVERTDLPGKRLWRVVFALPLAIPAYVAAICWLILLRRGGIVDQLVMNWFGLERGAVPLPVLYNLGGATLVISLCVFPYVFLPVSAALRSMDRAVEEAARLAGQRPWQVFWRVTLPLIIPALAAGALLVGLYSLSDFGTVAMLRYRTFTLAIYQQFGGQIDRSAAAILSVVLMVLALPLLLGEDRLARRQRMLVRSRTWQPRRLILLGPWHGVALAGLGLLALLAVGLPLLVLGGLSLQGWLAPTEVDRIWGINNSGLLRQTLQSVLLAGATATLACLLACVPALLAVRFPSRWSLALLALSKSPFALPGVIVGLSFVLLLNRWLPLVYGTMAALLIGFVFRLLPQAVAANETALRTVPPTLEQAARSLGYGAVAAFQRVTLPVAAPGLLASWALVFITAMKELPTAMLLRPPGFDTLPVRIWAAASESVHTQAAPPGLVLIVVTMLALVVVGGRRGLDKVLLHA